MSPISKGQLSLFTRAWHEVASIWWRRQLAKAEAELGMAGWLTCDFGEEVEHVLSRLSETERRQAQLINQRALAANEISNAEKQVAECEAIIAKASDQLSELDAEFTRNVQQINAHLSNSREKAVRFAAAADALEEELAGQLPKSTQRRPEWQVKIELTEVRSRREDEEQKALVLEAERISAEHKRHGKAAPLKKMIAKEQARMSLLCKQIDAARKNHTEAQRAIQQAERRKTVSYRKIGALMADAGVGSPNQPELLHRVLALREKLEKSP